MTRAEKYWIMAVMLILGSLNAHAQVLENYGPQIQDAFPSKRIGAYRQLNIKVDLQSFPQSDLKIGIPAGATVFWGSKLWKTVPNDTVLVVPLTEVVGFIGEMPGALAELTVIRPGISADMLTLQKRFFEPDAEVILAQVPTATKADPLQPQARVISPFQDFFFVALISIMLLVAIYKLVYPFVLSSIITPTSVVSAEDFSESTALQKFFSLDVIFYLLIINMTGFLLLMLYLRETGREALSFVVSGNLNQLFLYWLLGSTLMTALGVLKFSFLRAFGFLFELNRVVVPHFFYLLRIISITIFVIAFIVAVILLNNFIDLGIAVQYSLFGFFWIYLIGVFLLFWIMSSRVPFKNYHLFVYICTTELVPLLVISKIVIG